MIRFSFVLVAGLLFAANTASADLLCAKATYECASPYDGHLLIVNKQPVRFCTINDNLDKKQLIEKLEFYQTCNSLHGIVDIGAMNK